ncbi:MAG: NADH-quinone oxidoreductase subunit C [Clostridiales bacterium]|nr:NADH-quinone oxidoreductase subunit C [Clostridiales bacterium]
MHKADFTEITKDKILDIASEKNRSGCPIVVIAGYIDTEGRPVVSYSYDVMGQIETYKCIDEKVLPSITKVYGTAAEWFEEEISELMDVEFEGLDSKKRLFLPEEFDGTGQILVSPLSKLKKN